MTRRVRTEGEPTALEQAATAEALRARVDELDAQIALQRATGSPDPATLEERKAAVTAYQAARIEADRPRVE